MSVFPPCVRRSQEQPHHQSHPTFEHVLRMCQTLTPWADSEEVEAVLVRKYAILPNNEACEAFLAGVMPWLSMLEAGDANAVEDVIRVVHLYATLAGTQPRRWADTIDDVGFSTEIMETFAHPTGFLSQCQALHYPKFGEMQAVVVAACCRD